MSVQSGLTAVTIEGASTVDKDGPDGLVGDELIDVGLYFGSEDPANATAIRYIQLKHSTRRTGLSWTPGELEKTLAGFGARYRSRLRKHGAAFAAGRVRFQFISNRRFSKPILTSLRELAKGAAPTHTDTAESLVRFTGLKGKQVQAFFSLLDLDGSQPGVWSQRNLLNEELRGYLPDADVDGPVQLKELVTRKATSEFGTNPTIRREDVLRALKATEFDLFPAPSRIAMPADTIARAQEAEIIRSIMDASGPLIIHADGGVGKSVLAARLAQAMPAGSSAVLYDCYGVGLYRNPLDFRHRHRDGLVQIANELAARGWCHPLVPTIHADATRYMRAFAYRLEQAARHIRADTPDAVLCVIIDAADNAEAAAREQGDRGSFVRDLVRMPAMEGVRLVFTSRTHRVVDFDPPVEAARIELRPFDSVETGRHLRARFPDATDGEVAEFGHLSSHNPRVQALALQADGTLQDILKSLGPEPTTVAAAIGGLLQAAVDKLKSDSGGLESENIDRICIGLATLRPLVPIAVLAGISDVPEGAVRSFATDLGRPLRIAGDSLHFRDEPVETWFRETFKPPAHRLIAFVEALRPQASESAYVASALPELLLEGGFHEELVELALSGKDLPVANPLERRDVEVQRLVFALRACLRTGRYLDAAKIALRAAGETAGEGRQISLIQDNAELASALLSADRIEELVARRTFGSGWMGSHHACDAAIMADHKQLQPDAESRLRMAFEWLNNWSRRSKTDGDETVEDDDRLTLAYATLRLRGPRAAARFLRLWRHRPISFIAGRALASRLIDLGHFDDVQALGVGARNDVWLLLAVALELRNAGRALAKQPLKRLVRLLAFKRLKLQQIEDWSDPWPLLQAVAAAMETAALTLPKDFDVWAETLDRYLPDKPPHDLSTRFGRGKAALLRAYALRAALRGQTLVLTDLATEAIRKDLAGSHGHSEDARIFKVETGGLLPWLVLGADIVTGRVAIRAFDARAAAAEAESSKARHFDHRDSWGILSEIGVERAAVICRNGLATAKRSVALQDWVANTVRTPSTKALTRMAHQFGRTKGGEEACLHFADRAHAGVEAVRDDAESQGESLLALARAIYTVSKSEAGAYFDRAVEILSRIGDENVSRWECLLHLGSVAEAPGTARAETAYRLSRAAELTYSHVARDKHFDWDRTVDVLAGLDPASVLTILSRWRDRRFGESARLLPEALDALIRRELLSAKDRLAMAGIRAHWSRVEVLDAFLATAPTPETRGVGIEIALRYLRAEAQTQTDLSDLRTLAGRLGLDAGTLSLLEPLTAEKEVPRPKPEKQQSSKSGSRTRKPSYWNAIFRKLDPKSADDLRKADERMRSGEPPWIKGELFREAFARAGAGQEDAVIKAIGQLPDLAVFNLSDLVDSIPDAARTRLSVKAALKTVILALCRANPARVYLDTGYKTLSIETLKGALTRDEIVEVVLAGFADGIGLHSAEGLFRLARFAADKLSPDEADEALGYGLRLLDPLLTDEDGDGEWRDTLQPPSDVRAAVAGYIWAGLGSPVAALRWGCAHAVRGLAELGLTELLEPILDQAGRGDAGPFVDPGLPFYRFHARQWLLLGLNRAAVGGATPLAKETVALAKTWLDTDHVMIRGLSAELILHHHASGGSSLDPVERDRLAAINGSPYAPLMGHRYGSDAEDDGDPVEETYVFGIDAERQSFAPLGGCFGVRGVRVEHMALRQARAHLDLQEKNGAKDDPRHARGIFESMETYSGRGTTPSTEDLRDYQCYHALMLTAGELLRTRAPRQDPYGRPDDPDEFVQWLKGETLTRADGRWLSDRRDPVRLPPLPEPEGYDDRVWRWAVTRGRLDAIARVKQPDLCVWGGWTSGHDRHRETVTVRSALVSRVGGAALLRAARSTSEFNIYGLPSADDDDIGKGTLRLTGWVTEPTLSKGLDERDAWTGEGLSWPGPKPGSALIEELGLAGDVEGRLWCNAHGEMFRAESWVETSGYGRQKQSHPGDRLTVDQALLKRMLKERDQDLVLAVAVRRSLDRSAYSRDHDDTVIEYPSPYFCLYLVSPDGIRTF
nr:hypothetical protein [Brevundimonas diminuta]